jgi:hypothetical protein
MNYMSLWLLLTNVSGSVNHTQAERLPYFTVWEPPVIDLNAYAFLEDRGHTASKQ